MSNYSIFFCSALLINFCYQPPTETLQLLSRAKKIREIILVCELCLAVKLFKIKKVSLNNSQSICHNYAWLLSMLQVFFKNQETYFL